MDINEKLSSALSIVQVAKSKISVPTANFNKSSISIKPEESWSETITDTSIAAGGAFAVGGGLKGATAAFGITFAQGIDIDVQNDGTIVNNPDGTTTTTTRQYPVQIHGDTYPGKTVSTTRDEDGNFVSRITTVSIPDTDAASSPTTNHSTTTDANRNKTTETTVTSPTGGTYSASDPSSGQPDDHKSSADERQEEADRNSSPGMDNTGWTDNDGNGLG